MKPLRMACLLLCILLVLPNLTMLAESDPAAQEHVSNGNRLYHEGRYEEAIEAYKNALAVDPASAARYCCNIANSYFYMEMYDEAILWSSKAIVEDPAYTRAYGTRAACYMRLKLYASAFQDYTVAIEQAPEELVYAKYRNQAYQALGLPEADTGEGQPETEPTPTATQPLDQASVLPTPAPTELVAAQGSATPSQMLDDYPMIYLITKAIPQAEGHALLCAREKEYSGNTRTGDVLDLASFTLGEQTSIEKADLISLSVEQAQMLLERESLQDVLSAKLVELEKAYKDLQNDKAELSTQYDALFAEAEAYKRRYEGDSSSAVAEQKQKYDYEIGQIIALTKMVGSEIKAATDEMLRVRQFQDRESLGSL